MQRFMALLLVLMLLPAFPVAQGANDARSDTDRGYLSEAWRAGLGNGLGSLNSIRVADIDADGEDEILVGNAQGYLHMLDWNNSLNAWVEGFHSVDLGGSVKGMDIAQLDDDDALEIAVGYNWNGDAGKVRIIDGSTLKAEANWSSGISWSHTEWTEGWPYGLAMGDLDGDGRAELAMGADRGYLWVVDTDTPEIYVGRDVTFDEAEWYLDLSGSSAFNKNTENVWGVAMGQFDSDAAMEIAVGSKQGWVGIFDGETEELQWKKDMDGNDNTDSLVYGMLAADLNGNGIDELIVAQQSKLSVFIDGDRDEQADEPGINSGYGLAAADLFGSDRNELVVTDGSGNVYILGLSGTSLTTYQEWNSGQVMNTGAGVAISLTHDKPWIVHGGDAGILVAWEVTSSSSHALAWDSTSDNNGGSTLYSLPGGNTRGIGAGNIDSDPAIEILVGSGARRVYAFDGVTHEVDWVSPVLDELPMGIQVANLDDDSDNEIVISTGNPGEDRLADSDEGADGHLYVFDRSGSSFTQAFKSGNIDAALGVAVAELDDSNYPEIGVVTGYTLVYAGSSPPPPDHFGRLIVFGFDGSSYDEEGDSGELDDPVRGIAAGDADDDGGAEFVIGTRSGEVLAYHRSGSDYVQDGSTIDTGRVDAYGIAIADLDGDDATEIIVGTGKESSEKKPLIQVYRGSNHAKEWEKEVDTSSLWGVLGADFDNDGVVELIYGTSGGELFTYDGETKDFEAKTSALSGQTGHYGNIRMANLDGEGANELVVGSTAYLWIFTAEGQTNNPDLAIEGGDILVTPAEPTEDDDLTVNITLHNYGGAAISDWRVKIYDGDPDSGGNKITEYTCQSGEPDQRDGCRTIPAGEAAMFEVFWSSQWTTPGYHELYAKAEDIQSPRQETRFSNNKGYTTVEIEEIPNDAPVVSAFLDIVTIWVDEPVRIDAGDSYDNETTEGQADRDYGSGATMEYRYSPDEGGGWSSWMFDYTRDLDFTEPGEKEMKVQVRDERGKESEVMILMVTVKSNSAPIAMLAANTTSVTLGGYVTFDASASNDPDDRADLEFRFNLGDGVYSDWVEEGETVRLYRNALFDSQGNLLEGAGEQPLRDDSGIIRVFALSAGRLMEYRDSQLTGDGYNYTLPASSEQTNYMAQVMVRELPRAAGDESMLQSSWSLAAMVTVLRPDNVLPTAVAQVGIFVEGVGTWSDTQISASTGEAVGFSAADSTDPDGDDSALEYDWRVVDSRGVQFNLLNDRNSLTFTKYFSNPETYVATLTVTDERGGVSTATVQIVVKAAATTNGDEEGGLDLMKLLGLVLLGTVLVAGGAMVMGRLRGGDGGDEEFDDVSGPLELACPSCQSTIAVHTPQRPIQVGCPICQSQFILRE